ncbi:MAG: DUF951 domain-containing protein [Chloroflexi bacterium]|nr:DUF951 domain-containing protein [Chloroflexota bacterium]
MVMDLRLGSVLTLKKPHPCGGNRWRVERLGADIGLRCLRCRHYVLVPRPSLERRVRSVEPPVEGGAIEAAPHGTGVL